MLEKSIEIFNFSTLFNKLKPKIMRASHELSGIILFNPDEYKVFNTIGETKASGNINEETKTLDFNHLQPGAYNIQLNTTDGAILHSRFIIIK